jgi:Ca2+-binding RTX toxin-like protein
VDVDGDRQTDFEIQLDGLFQLDTSDFIDLTPGGFRIVGTAGADNLLGGAGADTLIGLAGNDVLNGGGGSDTADYSGTASNFRLDLELTTGQSTGTSGTDTLISIENLIGGNGANTFYGNAANNRLDGGAGNDLLDGRGGDDVLIGGLGKDQLAGRAGSDTFVFGSVADSGVGTAADRIMDFTRGVDKIDLRGIDANSGTAGDDAFTFIGANSFSKTAGELRYASTSGGTVLSGDVNGDGVADFEILLVNKVIPTSGDFML